MQYQVVFDITTGGQSSGGIIAIPWILVCVGGIFVALVMRRGSLPFPYWSHRPIASKLFSFSYLGFALLIALGIFLTTRSHNRALRNAIREGRVSVVEGSVVDFKPMPVSGHTLERFCISTRCFEYSDYMITGGFNNTASHGGPIKEGLPVRVTYVGDLIVKLEIAKPALR